MDKKGFKKHKNKLLSVGALGVVSSLIVPLVVLSSKNNNQEQKLKKGAETLENAKSDLKTSKAEVKDLKLKNAQALENEKFKSNEALENEKLKSNEALENEKLKSNQALEKIKSDLDQVKKDLESSKNEVKEFKKAQQVIVKDFNLYIQQLEKFKKDLELKKRLLEGDNHNLEWKNISLNDELGQLNNQLKDVKSDLKIAKAEVKDLDQQLHNQHLEKVNFIITREKLKSDLEIVKNRNEKLEILKNYLLNKLVKIDELLKNKEKITNVKGWRDELIQSQEKVKELINSINQLKKGAFYSSKKQARFKKVLKNNLELDLFNYCVISELKYSKISFTSFYLFLPDKFKNGMSKYELMHYFLRVKNTSDDFNKIKSTWEKIKGYKKIKYYLSQFNQEKKQDLKIELDVRFKKFIKLIYKNKAKLRVLFIIIKNKLIKYFSVDVENVKSFKKVYNYVMGFYTFKVVNKELYKFNFKEFDYKDVKKSLDEILEIIKAYYFINAEVIKNEVLELKELVKKVI